MRNLVTLLIMVAGITHARERIMSPEYAATFEARLRGWAQVYYPALTSTAP